MHYRTTRFGAHLDLECAGHPDVVRCDIWCKMITTRPFFGCANNHIWPVHWLRTQISNAAPSGSLFWFAKTENLKLKRKILLGTMFSRPPNYIPQVSTSLHAPLPTCIHLHVYSDCPTRPLPPTAASISLPSCYLIIVIIFIIISILFLLFLFIFIYLH